MKISYSQMLPDQGSFWKVDCSAAPGSQERTRKWPPGHSSSSRYSIRQRSQVSSILSFGTSCALRAYFHSRMSWTAGCPSSPFSEVVCRSRFRHRTSRPSSVILCSSMTQASRDLVPQASPHHPGEQLAVFPLILSVLLGIWNGQISNSDLNLSGLVPMKQSGNW